MLSFSEALNELKKGQSVTRSGWHGRGMFLHLQIPDENSANTLPYIYIVVPPQNGLGRAARVPWIASHTDLLENDWNVCSYPMAGICEEPSSLAAKITNTAKGPAYPGGMVGCSHSTAAHL